MPDVIRDPSTLLRFAVLALGALGIVGCVMVMIRRIDRERK